MTWEPNHSRLVSNFSLCSSSNAPRGASIKKEGWVGERNSLLLHYKQVAYEALYREQYEELLWSVWHTVKLLDDCRKRSARGGKVRTVESEYPCLADRLAVLIPSMKTIALF